MSRHLPTTLTIISLVMLSLSAPTPAAAADPKCIPNSSLFPETEQQDALSRFMCGPNGGTYQSAIPGADLTTSNGSLFSTVTPTSSTPVNPILGATFGSGLGAELTPGTSLGNKANENCNRFITPEPGDALSQFMCGPGGGKYLVPGLLNGLPNLPATSSPTSVLPALPTVLPTVSPQPARVSNEPAKLPEPPAVQVTPAQTTAPGAVEPATAPSLGQAAPPPAVAVNPPQTGTPASASLPKQDSLFDNPVFYLAVGLLVLLALAGGLVMVTNSGSDPEASDQEDSE